MRHVNEITIDIETIPSQLDWVKDHIKDTLSSPARITKQESIDKWWAEKSQEELENKLDKTALDGIWNHIICIGVMVNDSEPITFYAQTPEIEKETICDFYEFLDTHGVCPTFIGHNISGFDIPVIKKRSMILGLRPSANLPLNSKPWDKNPYDTMVQWDAKNYTKLDVLCKAFGIEGKGDVDGSKVYGMWKNGEHDRIRQYCCDDVLKTRAVYKKMTFAE